MSQSGFDFICGASTIGFIILSIVLTICMFETFGKVLREHLDSALSFSLEKKRAEHEAKIKLIKGLD